MDFGKYLSLFGISMIKFMFAPFGGPAMSLNIFETYLSCIAGAIVSATFFYYMSEFFLIRARKKHLKKIQEFKAQGKEMPKKKSFTWLNKFVVRIKRRFGIYGVSLFAPFFLSIPGGSIITAKFYGKKKITFPLIIAGILGNGIITTGLSYVIASFF